MTRITARNVDTVAANILDRLKRSHRVPADAYVAVTRSEPLYGVTYNAHVFRDTSAPFNDSGRYERIPTVLDRALDGITSTREAWQILNAILRTLDYPFDTYPDPHPAADTAAAGEH